MKLLTHPEECPNIGNISVNNPKPEFWNTRARYQKNKEVIAKGLADKETWDLYHKKLPLGHVPLAQPLSDRFIKKESTQWL